MINYSFQVKGFSVDIRCHMMTTYDGRLTHNASRMTTHRVRHLPYPA